MNKTIDFTPLSSISSSSTSKQTPSLGLGVSQQRQIIQSIYLGQVVPGQQGNTEASTKFQRDIKHKIQGYKQQDIKKKRYDADSFITFDQCLEILVGSKLTCYYCRGDCLIDYDTQRQSNQWTLERLNNDQQHQADNVVIACLKCNLGRRCQSSDGYKFTKTMVIQKIE